jgi:hypothetical protein
MAEKNNGTVPKGGITKTDAVRQALSTLGKDASRADIQKFVKDKHGYQMTPDQISTYKWEIQRKKGHTKKAVAVQPAAKKPEPKSPTPAPAPKSNGISLEDIETVKDLVERVGADTLRQLIGVLAR